MVDQAIALTRAQGVHVTRLECAADRPRLCAFCERLGYKKVGERRVGPFPTAFFAKQI